MVKVPFHISYSLGLAFKLTYGWYFFSIDKVCFFVFLAFLSIDQTCGEPKGLSQDLSLEAEYCEGTNQFTTDQGQHVEEPSNITEPLKHTVCLALDYILIHAECDEG